MARPTVIDCDPGVDDAIALLAALGAAETLDIRAICTVAGNVPVETCTRNALGILALAGRTDIPVHSGCDRPLKVPPVFAEHIHGASGLGKATLPDALAPAAQLHAVDYLCQTLAAAEPGHYTLVITGPMTNFASALQRDPTIVRGIKELVIMGGAGREAGNITEFAEFNIYADPDAARIVLGSGCPMTVIGLDATLQLRCTPSRWQRLAGSPHRASQIAAEMIDHVNRIYGEVYGAEGAALHDPCTIAYLLDSTLFTAQVVTLDVDCADTPRRGQTRMTAVDVDANSATINWITSVRDADVFNLLVTHMERL